jgi:hypothetical protein
VKFILLGISVPSGNFGSSSSDAFTGETLNIRNKAIVKVMIL